MLAPPTRGPIDEEATLGETVFMDVGCQTCHRPTIRSGPSAVRAINGAEFHPYSDFLLHDMGTLGDAIEQGRAIGKEMRTQPLWGLRNVNRFMHDGLTTTLEDAIQRHDGQGRFARDRFLALPAERRAHLLAFLRSL
jgi:CxxC motif-containing protein (DUF1111 family)